MSRTRVETKIESPVKATIFYNGKLGSFGKMSDVEGGGIEDVPLPLHFIVLDNSTHRITGKKSADKDAPRYRSTLAHESRGRKLKVWFQGSQDKVLAEGAWGSISQNLPGAKFTRCVYVMSNFGDGNHIYCIQLHGRALFAWMQYINQNRIDPCSDIVFSIKKTELMKGTIGEPSLVPVFTHSVIKTETAAAATELDHVLQAWLDAVFANGGADGSTEAPDEEAVSAPQPAAAPAKSDSFFPEMEPAGDDLPF